MRAAILFLAALLALLCHAEQLEAQRMFRIRRPIGPLEVGAMDSVKFEATRDNGSREPSPAGRCLSYTPSILRIEKNVVMRPVAPGRGILACAWMPGSEGLYIDTASVVIVPKPDDYELVIEWCHPRISDKWYVGDLHLWKEEPGVRDSAFYRVMRVWPDGKRERAPGAELDPVPFLRFTSLPPGTQTPCGPI